MGYENILKVVPTLQATALAEHNLAFLKKKKKKVKDFVGVGVTNMVGTSLIQSTADM